MPQESHFHPKAPPTLSHFLCAHCSMERRSLLQVTCRLRPRLHSAQARLFCCSSAFCLHDNWKRKRLRTGSRVTSYLLIVQNPDRLRKPGEFSNIMARFSSAHYVFSQIDIREDDYRRGTTNDNGGLAGCGCAYDSEFINVSPSKI